ncbi:hypothetical protein CY34DRAFT_17951 [Suillus luteus UH-Slu-Lm8-n1]|uniref:Uncharacterized protein n=1 Tax=Suillus luteus UH-Slu-Lm8-n1 TaxID=930992 RepID=A0A0C9ZXF1_9AGAM|nr:hypothetical protein CY34DRAFT_17951 [Suillus luteus UH-Slu-Lm8-n1]
MQLFACAHPEKAAAEATSRHVLLKLRSNFVRAPLNSLVGCRHIYLGPPIPKTNGKAKEDVLDDLPVYISEA